MSSTGSAPTTPCDLTRYVPTPLEVKSELDRVRCDGSASPMPSLPEPVQSWQTFMQSTQLPFARGSASSGATTFTMPGMMKVESDVGQPIVKHEVVTPPRTTKADYSVVEPTADMVADHQVIPETPEPQTSGSHNKLAGDHKKPIRNTRAGTTRPNTNIARNTRTQHTTGPTTPRPQQPHWPNKQ